MANKDNFIKVSLFQRKMDARNFDAKYRAQIQFDHIGKESQKKISQTKIAIIGCGSLGTRCAELLCRAGIGELMLFDKDVVEESNLQRQTLYTAADIAKAKAQTTREKLSEINKDVKIHAKTISIDKKKINEISSDLIIDCTDNIETRLIMNAYCIRKKIPLIVQTSLPPGLFRFLVLLHRS